MNTCLMTFSAPYSFGWQAPWLLLPKLLHGAEGALQWRLTGLAFRRLTQLVHSSAPFIWNMSIVRTRTAQRIVWDRRHSAASAVYHISLRSTYERRCRPHCAGFFCFCLLTYSSSSGNRMGMNDRTRNHALAFFDVKPFI